MALLKTKFQTLAKTIDAPTIAARWTRASLPLIA
jgi:hypothetical protein